MEEHETKEINIPDNIDLNHTISEEVFELSKSRIAIGLFIFTLETSQQEAKDKTEEKSNENEEDISEKSKPKKYYSLNTFYRNGIINYLAQLGFRKLYINDKEYELVRETDNIIEEVSISILKDILYENFKKNYNKGIKIEHNEIFGYTKFLVIQEMYLRQIHLILNSTFLQSLPNMKKSLLCDDSKTSYLFFKDCIIKVNADEKVRLYYRDLKDNVVHHNQIIDRNYEQSDNYEECHFVRFLKNICGNDTDKFGVFTTAIGFLIHNYNLQSKNQAVICYDETVTDKDTPQGGTGKGIFGKAISQVRKTILIDGKKFNGTNTFVYQRVDETTQVVIIDDANSNVLIDHLNSILTEGLTYERKFKEEQKIEYSKSPKILISSNTIFDNQGNTRKRRQYILEFGDYYSKRIQHGTEEPIKKEHGCEFFSNDWNEEEWNKFFTFMIECTQIYLKFGLKKQKTINVELNYFKQNVDSDFFEWIFNQEFELGKKYDTKQLFEEFKEAYSLEHIYKQRKFSDQLKYFAVYKNWDIEFKQLNRKPHFIFNSCI